MLATKTNKQKHEENLGVVECLEIWKFSLSHCVGELWSSAKLRNFSETLALTVKPTDATITPI